LLPKVYTFLNTKKPQHILLWNISRSSVFTFRLFNNRKRFVALLLRFTCQHLNIPMVFLKLLPGKKTVPWPILGNVLFILNAFMSTQRQTIAYHKPREQLLMAWCLICTSLYSSLAGLSLPFLCSVHYLSLRLLNSSVD